MKSSFVMMFVAIALGVTSCSKTEQGLLSDWEKSELLSRVVHLKSDMSRKEVAGLLGAEISTLDQGNDCIEVCYVKDPDSFIGRGWVSGGPHSFTGVTCSFIDGRLIYISINPGYVDQDRMDAYVKAYPVADESNDLRGQGRWQEFYDTQASRRNKAKS